MNRPTFKDKIKGDQIIMALSLSFAIITIMAVAFTFMDEETGEAMYILFAIAALELLVLVFRTRWINTVFDNGTVVRGTIIKMFRFGRNSNITVEYNFLGVPYKTRIMMNTWTIRRFRVDQQVDLVVDENKPKRVIVKELFVKE